MYIACLHDFIVHFMGYISVFTRSGASFYHTHSLSASFLHFAVTGSNKTRGGGVRKIAFHYEPNESLSSINPIVFCGLFFVFLRQ